MRIEFRTFKTRANLLIIAEDKVDGRALDRLGALNKDLRAELRLADGYGEYYLMVEGQRLIESPPTEPLKDDWKTIKPLDFSQTARRPDRDRWLITMAYLVSIRGTCPRAQVGALLVKDHRVISMGYNGSAPGETHCSDRGCVTNEAGVCETTIHAEVNCLAQAARMGIATSGTILYSTHSPCLPCAKLLLSAGVISLVYHRKYHDVRGLMWMQNCKQVEPLDPPYLESLVKALQSDHT